VAVRTGSLVLWKASFGPEPTALIIGIAGTLASKVK
jgi:hypothetical protein